MNNSGLLVALPALWFYEYFNSGIEGFGVEMESSSLKGLPTTQELAADATLVKWRPLIQSWRITFRRELFTCNPPLYLMKPNFRNLFMKLLTRGRVVPIISARVS
jgi:hypothetical protein